MWKASLPEERCYSCSLTEAAHVGKWASVPLFVAVQQAQATIFPLTDTEKVDRDDIGSSPSTLLMYWTWDGKKWLQELVLKSKSNSYWSAKIFI